MKQVKVGRCEVTVELNTPDIHGTGGITGKPLNGYDIVVSEDGIVRNMVCTNLMKFSEDDAVNTPQYERAIDFARKYSVLADALDMANHNLMCYSTNLLMDTPKPEWADQWHKEHEKVIVLEQMIKELPYTIYMEPKED